MPNATAVSPRTEKPLMNTSIRIVNVPIAAPIKRLSAKYSCKSGLAYQKSQAPNTHNAMNNIRMMSIVLFIYLFKSGFFGSDECQLLRMFYFVQICNVRFDGKLPLPLQENPK